MGLSVRQERQFVVLAWLATGARALATSAPTPVPPRAEVEWKFVGEGSCRPVVGNRTFFPLPDNIELECRVACEADSSCHAYEFNTNTMGCLLYHADVDHVEERSFHVCYRKKVRVSPGWYAAGVDRSCTAGCLALGLVCRDEDLYVHNVDVDSSAKVLKLVARVAGVSLGQCEAEDGTTAAVPHFKPNRCTFSRPRRGRDSFSCAARLGLEGPQEQRLCYCSEDVATSAAVSTTPGFLHAGDSRAQGLSEDGGGASARHPDCLATRIMAVVGVLAIVFSLASFGLWRHSRAARKTVSSDTDGCEVEERRKHPAWAANSLQQLVELRALAAEELGDRYADATMYDVCESVLRPLCDKHRKCYAHIVNGTDFKRVDVFVSHAWAENFDEFVESVLYPFRTWRVKPNVWICALALLQSTDPELVAEQVGTGDDPSKAPFTLALSNADRMLVVRNTAVDLFDRVWCCWEAFMAYENGLVQRPGGLIVSGPAWREGVQQVDISCARASNMEDKRRILNHITSTQTQFHAINELLTEVKTSMMASWEEGSDASTRIPHELLMDVKSSSMPSCEENDDNDAARLDV